MHIVGRQVDVIVDSMMGTFHPKHPDIYYPINYGYIAGTLAPDGEEQDVYIIGIDKPVKTFSGTVIAIVHRYDDIEDKITGYSRCTVLRVGFGRTEPSRCPPGICI